MITRIQQDLKPAMVAKDTLKVSVLRMAIAAFNNAVIARQGKALGLDDQYDVIKKLVKSRQDSIEQFIIAGQLDRAALEGKEIEILNDYLPKQLNDEELAVAVEAAIKQTGATSRKEMGAVMALLKQTHGATIDNKKASALVTAKLA